MNKEIKWIIIAGCNNSGTTLLYNALALHPEIDRLDEEGQGITPNLLPKPKNKFTIRLWTLEEEKFHMTENTDYDPGKIMIEKWEKNRIKNGKEKFVVEKSPPDCIRTRWMEKYIQKWTGKTPYFICIVRNGYAVAEGIQRRKKQRQNQDVSLAITANHWNRANEILVDDMKYLQNAILIKYEDLCDNFDGTMENISNFLKVENLFKDIKKIKLHRRFHIHNKKKKGIYNYNKIQLDNLTREEIELITMNAKPMLEYFGYLIHS